MQTVINVNKPADYNITRSTPDGANYTWTIVYPPVPSQSSFEKESDSEFSSRSPIEKRSFRELKRQGVIAMTPFRVDHFTRQNFVVGIDKREVIIRQPHVATSTACIMNLGLMKMTSSWTEQGDLRHWSTRYSNTLFTYDLNERPDLVAAIRSTQSAAVAAFKSGYDLLTELAEGRETLQFFGAVSRSASESLKRFLTEVEPNDLQRALKGRYSPAKLLKSADRGLRQLGSKWMAYRYAIMPLFYSFQDIKKLVEERGLLYKTFRQKEKIDIPPPTLPSGEIDLRFLRFWSGDVEIRSTVKAGYSKEGLRSFVSNQIGINPLATAYELVPLTFVFDWIVNMGDFIVSHTSLDFSEQSAMCTSVREKLIQETLLCVDQVDKRELVFGGPGNGCFPVSSVLGRDEFHNYCFESIRKDRYDNYRRFLFTSADVKLSLQSSMMNWKRTIDAAVLSHQSLKNLIKKAF